MCTPKCLALPSAVQISAWCTMAMVHMCINGQGLLQNLKGVGASTARQKMGQGYATPRLRHCSCRRQEAEHLDSISDALLGGTRYLCSSIERRNLHFKHTIKRNIDACQ